MARRLRRGTRRLVVVCAANSPFLKHTTWLSRGLADAPGSPFHQLGLDENLRNAGGAVGRRNYSFLTTSEGQRPSAVEWAQVFDDVTKPLYVDLGCGAGRYVMLQAHRRGPVNNYLGVDIHAALLERANGWAAAKRMTGYVHYHLANAVLSAELLLASYPGPVALVSIQYPDPHIRKQRHIVGPKLVQALAAALKPGGKVLLASDFEDTATYMRNAFERYGSHAFRPADKHAPGATFACRSACGSSSSDNVGASNSGSDSCSSSYSSSSDANALAHQGRQLARAMPYDGGTRRRGSTAAEASSGHGSDGSASAPERASSLWGPAGGSRSVVVSAVDDDDDAEVLLSYDAAWAAAGWLLENPEGAPTEREVYVAAVTQGQVYRVLLVRQ